MSSQPPLVSDLLLALAVIGGAAACALASLAAAQRFRLDEVVLRLHGRLPLGVASAAPMVSPLIATGLLAGATLTGLGLMPVGPMPILAGLFAFGGFLAIAMTPQRPAAATRPAVIVKPKGQAAISKAA